MEILRLLLNKLVVAEYFNRSWEKDFTKEFAPGSTIQIKFPQRFTVSDGMGYQPQGINRLSTTVSLDQWMQIAFEWDDLEAAVKLERSESELRENYLEPAAAAMAQEIDQRAAKWAYQNASNVVGVLRHRSDHGTDLLPGTATPDGESLSSGQALRSYLFEHDAESGLEHHLCLPSLG